MKLQLHSAQDQITLLLGPCVAQLSWKAAGDLRQQLIEAYSEELNRSSEKVQQQRLALSEALGGLEHLSANATEALEPLLQLPRQQLFPLIRILQKENPRLSHRLLTRLAELKGDNIHQAVEDWPSIRLPEAIKLLQQLQPQLAGINKSLSTQRKACEYLERLNKLPDKALLQLVKQLASDQQQQLVQLAKQLDVTALEQRLNQLPGLSLKAAGAHLSEQTLRLLLADVSRVLKQLKEEHLRSRSHA